MLHFPLPLDTRLVLSLAVLEGAAKYPFFLSVGQQVLAQIIVDHLAACRMRRCCGIIASKR